MNSKPVVIFLSVIMAVILLTGTCSAGFIAGRFSASASNPIALVPGMGNSTPIPGQAEQGGTPQEMQDLFKPFWQTWNLVEQTYVDQPVDKEAMMRGAISGMLDSLGDQHTSYLDPKLFEQASSQLEGEEYEGIGAWVDTTGDYLTVISPMPGSPAEEAGLKTGDKIVAVDGEDMTGIDGELVRQRVIGPAGSTVRLTIQRAEQEPFEVQVKRSKIVVPTVESKMLEGNIAYVHLYTFGDDTSNDLRKALNELMDQKPAGLILDLRNNGGGYLNTAIEVVSEFIGDGAVMYEEYGDGRRITFEAKKGGVATEIPMVVLINEGSASASEIVAGAIQDVGRGKLVGVTSYGKGSVQTYTPLENNEGAVRITIARWLTPNGRQISGVGLEPDVTIEFTEADIAAGIDVQLEKAIELLTQQ